MGQALLKRFGNGAEAMTDPNHDFELVHGSGNVFRDFGHPDADVLQTKGFWPPVPSAFWTMKGCRRARPRLGPASLTPTSPASATHSLADSPSTG